jgi:tripartite-type tricarboxylate transporter receptor subunit TctC
MRLICQKVTESTGQKFVIDSRAGGGGVVGALAVKRSSPDGHTLFQGNLSHVLLRAIQPDVPFDLVADFEAVIPLWSFPYLLVVPAGSPARTVKEFIALAKSRPEGLSFGSPGVGTPPQLIGEMVRAKTGVTLVHVPYKGAAPALIDLIAGRLDSTFVSYAAISSFVQDGKLRVLGTASSHRIPELPGVPTFSEQGLPDIEMSAWFGLFAPARTSNEVIQKLHGAFERAVQTPDVAKRMRELALDSPTGTPLEFSSIVAADTKRIGELAKAMSSSRP